MKVNGLKLIQVELFSFFQFTFTSLFDAAINASELFCMAHLANNERF